jgi:ferric-dicitrate binding protein FerR (iron transport regulator)
MTTDLAFRRLRAANPCRPATTVDADALFDRITILASDPRLRRQPRRSRRRVLAVAVALVLAAALATAAPAISNWLGDIIGPSEVNSEYAGAQGHLSLPARLQLARAELPVELRDEPRSRGFLRGHDRPGGQRGAPTPSSGT